MNRRDMIMTMGAMTLSAAAGTAVSAERHTSNVGAGKKLAGARGLPATPIALGDAHFLSATNPLATVDQRDLEALALEVMQMPAVIAGQKMVERQWRAIAGRNVGEQAWAQFDDMVGEYVFNSVLEAVNNDPNYPKVMGVIFAPPHEWFGKKIPGSRTAGPNPDNTYREIPIDPSARYEVIGKCFDPAPGDFTFTLMSNVMYTRAFPILQKQDIKLESDGSFRITVGPEAANGRPNHLQTSPAVKLLYMRDTRTDWAQIPNALRVRRIEPPRALPMTSSQMADRAAAIMMDNVPNTYWWMGLSLALEPNLMTQPNNTGGVGGLASQQTCFGRGELADDEALVITVAPGGAGYRALSLYDYWYRTIDPGKYISSYANMQAIPNADGTTTHVVSSRDPGVFNWLDTSGQRQFLLLQRWQGLPRDRSPENDLAISTKLVKLDDLSAALPDGMKRVTSEERSKQVDERLAQYRMRYVDR